MSDLPVDAVADADQVLRSALSGDRDAVVSSFDAVLGRAGMVGAYDVAWCLAAATVGGQRRDGIWTLDFPGIEEAGYDTRWVARFLSAYANADASTSAALFGAALADGQLPRCLLTLAGSAAATLRRRAA